MDSSPVKGNTHRGRGVCAAVAGSRGACLHLSMPLSRSAGPAAPLSFLACTLLPPTSHHLSVSIREANIRAIRHANFIIITCTDSVHVCKIRSFTFRLNLLVDLGSQHQWVALGKLLKLRLGSWQEVKSPVMSSAWSLQRAILPLSSPTGRLLRTPLMAPPGTLAW